MKFKSGNAGYNLPGNIFQKIENKNQIKNQFIIRVNAVMIVLF